ncbi:MAG: DUF4097 family beta strand repeat-containing protein [Holophagae bacterium]|jgi:DUF4097 and DUF4098 domain-containing protein YvlB
MNTQRTALVLGLTWMLATGVATADTAVDETRPLAADGRVEINNVAGSVEVVGWSDDQVEITGTLGANVDDLEISSGGSRLEIVVKQARRSNRGASAFLTVKMPRTADLDVETVSAEITVENIDGDLSLESVSGEIEVAGRPRSIEAVSVSGDVRVASTSGRSKLESVSGNIVVGQALGELETDVVSGNIGIDAGRLDGFDAETVSGSITCAAQPGERARFSIESMSGTVELVLPAGIDADFDIETYSGSISNQFGPEATRSDEYGPGKELRFRAGSGGARIEIESFSGDVRLRTE